MMFVFYNILLLILSPIIALYILYRIFISGKSRKSWRHQLGGVKLPNEIADKKKIWIHAVSVGESVAASSVVSELKRDIPEVAVVMSTTTEKGQEMAHKSVKDSDGFFYYPFDLLPSVSRSLSKICPVVFASTDTEIWPNFLHIARRRGVKTAMINGTVSDKTMAGSKKIGWLYRWAMSNFDLLCMQSQADADRAVSLGADESKVVITGNCKADEAPQPLMQPEREELLSLYKIGAENLVFVAGSTNPGEEPHIIESYALARKTHPSLRLIVAPRQIERRKEIYTLVKASGLECGWRSDPSTITGAEDVVILDTFGELARIYAIADVTFVGGSLIPRGCHSILQPIAQGKPVFFGPYTFKAKDLVAQAKAAGVGFEIKNGMELGLQISRMLDEPEVLRQIEARCEDMIRSNKRASRRTADELRKLYKAAISAGSGNRSG